MADKVDNYKGLSDEAAKEYEKRQAEPLFKTVKDLIPMEQVKEYYGSEFEVFLCDNHHKWAIRKRW